MNEKRGAAYRLSATVALALAVLTGIEYYAGIHHASTVVMFLLALLKGVAVLNWFMHVARLWTAEGEH
jgi:hypothetical protein